MKVLEPIITNKPSNIYIEDVFIQNNSISGDKIDGGTITNFRSDGIKDTAKNKQIIIQDDKVEIKGAITGADATLHTVTANAISSPTVTSHTVKSQKLDSQAVFADSVHVKDYIKVEKIKYNKAEADNFDVKKSVRINLREVLWEDRLGNSVINSALQEVGVLNKLQVGSTLSVEGHRVGINTKTPQGYFAVDQGGDQIVLDFKDGRAHMGMYTISDLDVGNGKTQITIKANGNVGIGVKQPTQALEVDGNIKYKGKTITAGVTQPNTGNWQKGDICYNDNANVGDYVGWICVRGGNPGTWSKFGLIV
jgi:signal peptidase I